jgi:hypothetical protein
MRLVHIELSVANQMVGLLHRHHLPVAGHRFSLGAVKDARLVGVAIVGRPVARMRDQVNEVEVLRIATDGTKNACSFLLGACGRAAKALGYVRIQTFTLEIEGGGASWQLVGRGMGMSIMAHGIDHQGVGIKQNIPHPPRSDGLEHSMTL